MNLYRACLIIDICIIWSFANVSSQTDSKKEANITAANNSFDNQSVVTVQMPLAEKLIRFRRQPSVTIFKHVIRSPKRSKPRRRIKRPKVRYGPPPAPSSPFNEHTPYYKPQSQYAASIPHETPSFSLDEFQHINLDAADFELLPSSYEAQSMDLDFYGHSEDDTSSYHSISTHPTTSITDEYSSNDVNLALNHNIDSSYSYKPQLPRKPHRKYGLPKTFEYSSDFNAERPSYFPTTDYSSYNSFQANTETTYGSGDSKSPPFESNAPTHIPPSHYNIHSGTSNDVFSSYGPPREEHRTQYYPPVSSSGSNDIYEKKILNSNYGINSFEHGSEQITNFRQNFATQHNYNDSPQSPPKQTPENPIADIDLTYSSPYEVNLLNPTQPNSENQPPHNQLNEHHSQQPGNFAEPPTQSVNTFHATEIAPQPGAVDDYVPPTQELPLNPQHKQPPYDFPKSSYEVPIYDPIPFDASTNDEQEFYPPNHYDIQPPEETRQRETSILTNFQNDHHQQQQQSVNKNVATFSRDAHASESDLSTTSTKSLRHNRKRTKNVTSVASSKHTLDVPELKKAYDAAKQNKEISYPPTRQTDADVNASTHIAQKQAFLPTQPFASSNENFFSQTWNPKRVKTPSNLALTFKSTIQTESTTGPTTSPTTHSKQSEMQFKPRPRLTQSVPPSTLSRKRTSTSIAEKIKSGNKNNQTLITEIISIEKSHSKSYYDGTLAPPILTMSNLYNTRINQFKSPTHSPALAPPPKPALQPRQQSTNRPYNNKNSAPERTTTKNIFDTTHFKAPQNDKDAAASASAAINYRFSQTLPKNHKLF